MSAFPQAPDGAPARDRFEVLHRVEMDERAFRAVLIVQSATPPSWEQLPAGYALQVCPAKDVGTVYARLEAGMRLRFRLRANPTRRVHQRATLGPHEERGRQRAEDAGAVGKRVELRHEEDQLAWLERKASDCGFGLLTTRLLPADREVPLTRTDPAGQLSGRNGRGQHLIFATALFEGVLEVSDATKLRSALATGIGPAKAFGCGLLSLARASAAE
jgi:CRISPR system Cascade subunit CasE